MSGPIRYLDVCSGYSAFTVASAGMGFQCAGYSEIEAFPAAMLGHHYGAGRARYMPDPDAPFIDAKERKARLGLIKSMASLRDSHFGNRVTNFGDFTQIREDDVGPVDLLIGGTPCQAFSVAGKRLGLDDPRGNLTLEFLALARRLRVPWLAWENVHGFLSHDEGRTMGTFLRLLGEIGYGWAYRVLDVQYIRVGGFPWAIPQRRRRVFVVAHLGDQAGPAAVLFDRESLRGDPAPRRETGQGVAGTLGASAARSRGAGTDPAYLTTAAAFGFDASEDGTGHGTPIVPVAYGYDGESDTTARCAICGCTLRYLLTDYGQEDELSYWLQGGIASPITSEHTYPLWHLAGRPVLMGIELPDWPRMLRRQKAAAYCDLSIAAFEREVLAGRLPHPVMLGGKEHWSRVAIDNALERLSGEAPDDWRAKAPLYRERYA